MRAAGAVVAVAAGVISCIAALGRPLGAQSDVPTLDSAAVARALADSLRPLGVRAVLGGGLGGPPGVLAAPLAAALGVPLAAPGAVPPCRVPGAGPRYLASAYLVGAPAPRALGRRELRVRVGLRSAASAGVPRSGYASDWTYCVVRAGARWRVSGKVGTVRAT